MPKEAALSPLLLLDFPPTGLDADRRSLAARLRRARGAQSAPLNKEKNPEKSNELDFSGFFSLFLCQGTRLATINELAEASLFADSSRFAGCFFAARPGRKRVSSSLSI